ncbi:MAG TPA: type II toxin-antitoxin system VapC family toxin [Roseiarcus sp.]|nr:type II toxin-antitoxin system VapC family toxin [Roseiarcus sp.]
MTVVLDASLALTWFFEDEATPETDRLLDRVSHEGAVVPALWRLELGNVLLQAERRGRISAANVERGLALVGGLPISVDPETISRAWRDTLALARTERLTVYDASYLELAIRRRIPLLTLGEELAAAIRRQGNEAYP